MISFLSYFVSRPNNIQSLEAHRVPMGYMQMHVMIKKFLQDESGQTTTEYILILAVIVTIIMQFKNKLKGIMEVMFGKLERDVSSVEDGGGAP